MKRSEKLAIDAIWMSVIAFGVMALLITLNGCSQCTHLETTCHGSRLEVCNASERWDLVVDCQDYGTEFVCIETFDEAGESEAVCVPEEYTR